MVGHMKHAVNGDHAMGRFGPFGFQFFILHGKKSRLWCVYNAYNAICVSDMTFFYCIFMVHACIVCITREQPGLLYFSSSLSMLKHAILTVEAPIKITITNSYNPYDSCRIVFCWLQIGSAAGFIHFWFRDQRSCMTGGLWHVRSVALGILTASEGNNSSLWIHQICYETGRRFAETENQFSQDSSCHGKVETFSEFEQIKMDQMKLSQCNFKLYSFID